MKKSDYTRSTIECSYAELKPKFMEYLKAYAKIHNLGDVEMEVQHCFEVKNLKKGFFGQIKTSYTDICFTPKFLFWGTIFDKKESGIGCAQWSDLLEIWNWEDSEMGKLFEEQGVEIYGFLHLSSHRSKWFIGIGEDEAGEKCKKLLKELIVKK